MSKSKRPDEERKPQEAPVTTQNEAPEDEGAAASWQPNNDEQMLRRQSAPRPYFNPALSGGEMGGDPYGGNPYDVNGATLPGGGMSGLFSGTMGTGAALNGFDLLEERIKKEDVQKAGQTLLKYKQGKAHLEQRIVENEQWYKLRHWGMIGDKKSEVEPISAWLFNAIANKHADAMDNFPAPTVLPREEGDKGEAQMLTSVIPVVLDQNDFEQTYNDVWMYKLKTGTGVYGIFWDKEKANGLGDIEVAKCDVLNLFWEPGITDIQKSPNFFSVQLVNNDDLLDQYPQLEGKLSTPTMDMAKYIYDDSVDTSEKSVVVDWYYKRRSGGRTVLHYCKYCNDVVLYASENDPELRDRGWYDHGDYPFVFDPLYQVEGTPAGFGYVDIGKSPQTYIDRLGQAVLQNTFANTRPRYFVRENGGVNEKEYADQNAPFVHVKNASLGDDSIRPIEGKPLAPIYFEVMQGKIEELKETTGNRDVNTGGTAPSVTAASAIAAMQEAGGKLSRDNSKAAYRAYRRMILQIIELIRQFYDLPRTFRILGENGTQQYIMYSNAGLQPQPLGQTFGAPGMEQMYRLPLFDVEVSAQRASPYSKLSQNEMALSFYTAGMFNPEMATQALTCLDMMDFDRKEMVMQKVAQNGAAFMQMMAMQNAMMASGSGAGALPNQEAGQQAVKQAGKEDTGTFSGQADESPVTKKARQATAERTMPR